MFDFEQQIKWGERAEEIVKEAAKQYRNSRTFGFGIS